ncbi:MAG TPA: LysR family transcriptional regulator [Kiloniellaceae bacterium]|nr:LysR family transcriptional regulator [Kiloniellaceae bacterium]
MRDENWDDLRFFLAAARGGSFAAAARRLGVNESTAARRIARLEETFDCRLFLRSAGRLAVTPAGEGLQMRVEAMEREMQAAAAVLRLADKRVAGRVRLTAVPLLVNRLLLPALPPLLAAHPALELELIAEPRDLSLTKREADLALRLARPTREQRILARRLGVLAFAVYGPADAAVEHLPWVTYEDAMADLPQARWIAREMAKTTDTAPPRVSVNDAEGILAAVRAGLGKSLLPVRLAETDPALRRLGDGPPSLHREIWLLTHPDLRALPRIQAVTDWLRSVLF